MENEDIDENVAEKENDSNHNDEVEETTRPNDEKATDDGIEHQEDEIVNGTSGVEEITDIQNDLNNDGSAEHHQEAPTAAGLRNRKKRKPKKDN